MPNAFPGLSAAEWADIHDSVLEAMGFVLIPAVFHAADPAEVDDLYGEATDGDDNWTDLPEIGVSYKYKPSEEHLTRQGLKTEAEVLLFIPRGEVLRWEETNARPFVVGEDMEVTVAGKTFNVFEAVTDPLPVDDGAATDFIGMVVTGYKER